jgi:hypothetical protein
LETLLRGTAPVKEALRWREVEGATVFLFERELPVPFDEFIAKVDVACTIGHMNDYIGGVVVPRLSKIGLFLTMKLLHNQCPTGEMQKAN